MKSHARRATCLTPSVGGAAAMRGAHAAEGAAACRAAERFQIYPLGQLGAFGPEDPEDEDGCVMQSVTA